MFVDFMYAVTVGVAMSRLDEKSFQLRCPLLWGCVFMIAVFLEDLYIYHVKVVPSLRDTPSARSFILAMLIIGAWYTSQAAFPSNQKLFLVSFGLFFLLKLLGGVLMGATKYPASHDLLFLIPAATAAVLACFTGCEFVTTRPWFLLAFLFPAWLVTVTMWWRIDG